MEQNDESKIVSSYNKNLDENIINEGVINEPFIKDEKIDLKRFVLSCIETGICSFLDLCPGIIQVIFISRNNTQITVSGFGLSIILSNCIGTGLYYGLSTGLEMMASHSFGAKNYRLTGLLLYRCLLVQFIMFPFLVLIMVYSKQILLLWNNNEEICEIASQYCIYLIPSILLFSVFLAIKSFLNAQNEYRLQVQIAFLNFPLFILYCYLFIEYHKFGIVGAAIAIGITRLQSLIFLFIGMKIKPILLICIQPLSLDIFKNIWPFLKVAVPIGAIISSDWIIYETASVIASNLPINQYSAHIVLSNFNGILFAFPYAYSIVGGTFIGNEMGNKSVTKAKAYIKYTFSVVLTHMVIFLLMLVFLKHQLALALTVDQQVLDCFENAYYIFLVAHFLDMFQVTSASCMRAIGKENISCLGYLLLNGVVGLPSAYLLAYKADLKLKGIWLGIIIGSSLNYCLQFSQIFCTNFTKMIKVIAKRNEKDIISCSLQEIE